MKKIIPYNCCFCDKPGQVEYEESDVTSSPQFTRLIAALPKKIACTRCAAFETKRSHFCRLIVNLATQWSREPLHTQSQLQQMAHERMTRTIQKLCNLYEIHFHTPPLFDSQMAGLVLENPEKAWKIVNKLDWAARHCTVETY